MKMSDHSNMSEVEASVLGQCLDFTSNVIKDIKSFSFHLKMSNGFVFNFSNTEKRNSLLKDTKLKKTSSPSTLARNKTRMEKFIAIKKSSALNANSDPSTDKETSDVTLKDSDNIANSTFKCDLCSYENTPQRKNLIVILHRGIKKNRSLVFLLLFLS